MAVSAEKDLLLINNEHTAARRQPPPPLMSPLAFLCCSLVGKITVSELTVSELAVNEMLSLCWRELRECGHLASWGGVGKRSALNFIHKDHSFITSLVKRTKWLFFFLKKRKGTFCTVEWLWGSASLSKTTHESWLQKFLQGQPEESLLPAEVTGKWKTQLEMLHDGIDPGRWS